MMAQQELSFKEKRPHNIIKSNISRLRKPVGGGELSIDNVKMMETRRTKAI